MLHFNNLLSSIIKLQKWFLFFVFSLIINFSSIASHIVGGEMSYIKQSDGTYKIILKVYRDCLNGLPALDNPAVIKVYDNNNSLVTTYNVPLKSSRQLPTTYQGACAPMSSNLACVEEGIYEYTVDLPPKKGGYTLAYQRCCRNATIININNPSNIGATFYEHIPGPEEAPINSSPMFINTPPIYVCKGIPLNLNFAAFDADELKYELGLPVKGGSSGFGGVNVTTPPPFQNITYVSPFSALYPMNTNPDININETTGLLNGSPAMLGQWVIMVIVKEYRNGVQIGTHRREFQFNVVNCGDLVVANVLSQISTVQDPNNLCTGLFMTFSNNSGPNPQFLQYWWNFGDPTTLADTSKLYQPSYAYPAPGIYTITLIAKSSKCSDTSKAIFRVFPKLKPTFIGPKYLCLNKNSSNFFPSGDFQGNGTFNWSFGPNANPQSANTKSVTNVVYLSDGVHSVSLTIKENSCTATHNNTVLVIKNPTASINLNPFFGCVGYSYTFASTSSIDILPTVYNWSLSSGYTSTISGFVYEFNNPGIYDVTLGIKTVSFCIDSSRFSCNNCYTIQPSPTSKFDANPRKINFFDAVVSFSNQSYNNPVRWLYDFADGGYDTILNPVHVFKKHGKFNTVLTVTNKYNCKHSSYIEIEVTPEYRFWIPNAFTPTNKDDINTVFKPIVSGVSEYCLNLYNRQGELLYTSKDPENDSWDGTYKGVVCKSDIYVWQVFFKNLETRKMENYQGHVYLFR